MSQQHGAALVGFRADGDDQLVAGDCRAEDPTAGDGDLVPGGPAVVGRPQLRPVRPAVLGVGKEQLADPGGGPVAAQRRPRSRDAHPVPPPVQAANDRGARGGAAGCCAQEPDGPIGKARPGDGHETGRDRAAGSGGRNGHRRRGHGVRRGGCREGRRRGPHDGWVPAPDGGLAAGQPAVQREPPDDEKRSQTHRGHRGQETGTDQGIPALALRDGGLPAGGVTLEGGPEEAVEVVVLVHARALRSAPSSARSSRRRRRAV